MKLIRKKFKSFNMAISYSNSRQKYELWLIYYKDLKHFKFRLSYLEIQMWIDRHL